MQPTLIRLQNITQYTQTDCKSYTKIAFIFVFIYVRVRVCAYCSLKANIFALYIAHFAVFVLKICINLGKNSLICCKRLKIQIFLAKCLVGCKYLCTFASQFRGIAQAKLLIDTNTEGVKIVGQQAVDAEECYI